MSTLRVSAVNNAAATTGGLSIDSSGVVSGGLPSPNRNLLYNGAMQVAQRGTSASSLSSEASTYKTADRWCLQITSGGTWTQSVESDAPTGSGLSKSLKMLCTTANASLSAGSQCQISQRLEGQDLQRVAKGSASAQQLTLSFWVKSNVTGTYVVMLYDADNTRSISQTYSVSASATWEKKTLTFSADTTGAFVNDNSDALHVYFGLVEGSTFTSGALGTTWGAYADNRSFAGQTNLAAATNNYWQVTGVQLEVGPTATPFEFKSFGQELRECQRYYYRNSADQSTAQFAAWSPAQNTTVVECFIPLPVSMRTTPTSGGGSNLALQLYGGAGLITVTATGIESSISSRNTLLFRATVASGLTAGTFYRLLANSSTSAFIECSAEL